MVWGNSKVFNVTCNIKIFYDTPATFQPCLIVIGQAHVHPLRDAEATGKPLEPRQRALPRLVLAISTSASTPNQSTYFYSPSLPGFLQRVQLLSLPRNCINVISECLHPPEGGRDGGEVMRHLLQAHEQRVGRPGKQGKRFCLLFPQGTKAHRLT
jgi:hypothetical protein